MKVQYHRIDTPSGVVDKGEKVKYSGEKDYSIGSPRKNGMVNKETLNKGFSNSETLDTGLTFKEPI